MTLGGTRPLPDLFAAAGIKFDFSRPTIERIATRISRELENLPD